MKIAVDFDATLANTHELVIELINFKLGTTYTINDVTSWNWWSSVGIEPDFWAVYDLMDRTHLRRAIRPVSPFAPAAVKWLVQQGHEVDIVTSNNHTVATEMQAWAFGHGLDCPVKTLGRGTDKLALPYDMFIDDAPQLAEALLAHPDSEKHMLLVDQPWNREIRLPLSMDAQVVRLFDWKDAQYLLAEELGWV